MAIPSIKGTYSLDPDTVRAIESLARRWGTSKSEVLRRAVRAAAQTGAADLPGLAALERLQSRSGLSAAKADRWAASAREERRSR